MANNKKDNRKRNIAIGASIAGGLGALGTGAYFLRRKKLGKTKPTMPPNKPVKAPFDPSGPSIQQIEWALDDVLGPVRPVYKPKSITIDDDIPVASKSPSGPRVISIDDDTPEVTSYMRKSKKGKVHRVSKSKLKRRREQQLAVNKPRAKRDTQFMGKNQSTLNFNMYRPNKFRF
jgi:hypothetical protein